MAQSNENISPLGQYVHTNDLKIYYEEAGNGESLLLLHGGLGTGIIQWADHLPIYSEHFKIIMPDARAHGKTNNPAGKIDTSLLAADAVALIHALGLKKPFICGWSMGGDTALEIAIKHPGIAKAFVIGGVTHRIDDTYLAGIKELGIEGPGQVSFEQLEKNNPQMTGVIKTLHTQEPDHWKALLKQLSYAMMTTPDYTREEYQQITEPILLILGDRDQYVHLENYVELYRLIPHSELAIIPQSDHSVARSKAGIFAKFALDFMLRYSSK